MADLIKYVLDPLKEVREFKALAAVGSAEYTDIWSEMDAIRANQFIESLDSYGCSRMEEIMGLTPKATDTVEIRRFRLKAKNNEKAPFTFNIIEAQIAILCGFDGYTFGVDYANHVINVRVALTAKGMYDEIEKLLLRVRPANMVLDLSLLYNQYLTFEGLTNAELSAYTHDELRNEVIA